jgi:hypothetical protein
MTTTWISENLPLTTLSSLGLGFFLLTSTFYWFLHYIAVRQESLPLEVNPIYAIIGQLIIVIMYGIHIVFLLVMPYFIYRRLCACPEEIPDFLITLTLYLLALLWSIHFCAVKLVVSRYERESGRRVFTARPRREYQRMIRSRKRSRLRANQA